MGFLGGITNALGITQGGKRQAANDYNATMEREADKLHASYDKARPELTAGFGKAVDTTSGGFQTARADTQTGFGAAKDQYAQGGQDAVDTAKSGYSEAKGMYNTPEMVSSRSELYNRVLGKGGFSPETTDAMKASARDEYGTALRGVSDAQSQYYGGATGAGAAGENLARAASDLGQKRATATREIDLGNEQLKRQEMTGAIGSLQSEAGARAGLSSQEAQYVSGLQEKIAAGGAGLSAQEGDALAKLAAQEGTTVGELQARLASGQAGLTVEEAKAIAEMMSQGAAAKLQQGSQPGMLEGLAGAGLGVGLASVIGCWVARVVYGQNSPKWLVFRKWVIEIAPSWFRNLYIKYGPRFAEYIKDKPKLTKVIKWFMDKIVNKYEGVF